MKAGDRDVPYLRDVLDAVDRVERYTADGKGAFLADTLIQDAVLRNLEVIGEAVKQLSDDVRSRAADVPWRQIAGMRDKLIHDYLGVNLELVWTVVERNLPVLRDACRQLVD